MNVYLTVDKKGPFFQAHPDERVKSGVLKAVKKLVELGQGRLAQILRKGPEGVYLSDGKSTGNYRRNVRPVFKEGGMSALITDGGVVYGPWLEGVSSRNDTTRFKGYASFRKTAEWLNQQAPAMFEAEMKLISSELR